MWSKDVPFAIARAYKYSKCDICGNCKLDVVGNLPTILIVYHWDRMMSLWWTWWDNFFKSQLLIKHVRLHTHEAPVFHPCGRTGPMAFKKLSLSLGTLCRRQASTNPQSKGTVHNLHEAFKLTCNVLGLEISQPIEWQDGWKSIIPWVDFKHHGWGNL